MTRPWYEDDELWRALRPVLFPDSRVEDARGEVDQALELLDLEAGARVLDLPCGVGRHSIELARRGFRVTAVDRTRPYLDETGARAEAEGLELELVESDMREFRRPAAFDGALNLFSSFGYFDDEEDDRRVGENLAASVREGGALLIDTFSKEVLARDFSPRSWSEADGVLLLEERTVARDWTWIENRWIVIPPEGPRTELELSLRIYSARELTTLLESCGFRKTTCYGALDGRPYDQEAKRLVVLAER